MTLSLLILFWAATTAYSLPLLDPHENTLVPFSLSPGNVNLETYFLDKYNRDGKFDTEGGTPHHIFPFNVNQPQHKKNFMSDIKLIRRVKRSPGGHGHGYRRGGHGGHYRGHNHYRGHYHRGNHHHHGHRYY